MSRTRTAIVTGSTSDIGLAVARALAADGCHLVFSGFGRVDVLVNSAGIQHTVPLEAFPDEKWDAVLAVNLLAAFHATKAVLPGMRKRNYGRVVNVASVHGLVGFGPGSPCRSKPDGYFPPPAAFLKS